MKAITALLNALTRLIETAASSKAAVTVLVFIAVIFTVAATVEPSAAGHGGTFSAHVTWAPNNDEDATELPSCIDIER